MAEWDSNNPSNYPLFKIYICLRAFHLKVAVNDKKEKSSFLYIHLYY